MKKLLLASIITLISISSQATGTATWKGYLGDDYKWNCKSGGNDCTPKKSSSMTNNELTELANFNAYFNQQLNPCDYFNSFDYSILFSDMSANIVAANQNSGLKWYRFTHSDGSTTYAAIPATDTWSQQPNVVYSCHVN